MGLNQLQVGEVYTPSQLTQIIRDSLDRYAVRFRYSHRDSSLGIKEADTSTEVFSLERLGGDDSISLETEFVRRDNAGNNVTPGNAARGKAVSRKIIQKEAVQASDNAVYFWLRLILTEEGYQLNAVARSTKKQDYLNRQNLVLDMDFTLS